MVLVLIPGQRNIKKMKKSDINPMPDYFDRYINLVADVEIVEENYYPLLGKG